MACPSCSQRTANPSATARVGDVVAVTIRCGVCAHTWDLVTEHPPMLRMPTPRDAFEREVEGRFGVLPNFFCSADAAPGLLPGLWTFATAAYLDSPLPSVFKERLFVHLSRFCRIRYCIVRHVGFLIGYGRPAGDPAAALQTVEHVVQMLQRSVPEGPALDVALARLGAMPASDTLPEPGTQFEHDLFDALTVLFLSPVTAVPAGSTIRTAVGATRFELLVAFLAFIRTAHYWTETHPELAFEADMVAMLSEHRELAGLLLDAGESELIKTGLRLREALVHTP